MAVEEHRIELAGAPVYYTTAPADGVPVLYLHGAPTSSDDFVPFLERTGGLAPDLLGFGRSAKGANLVYSLDSHADFITDLLEELGIGDVQLVGHSTGGAAGLVFAQRDPDRVTRMVLIDPMPLFSFAQNRFSRLLRARGAGELAMGSITRLVFTRGMRRAAVSPEAWPPAGLSALWEQFDQGTQRAILRMLRYADDRQLDAAGAHLERLSDTPALIAWGEHDPWLPATLADEYALRLPHAELRIVPGAGHWPWLSDPGLIDAIADFLE